MQRAVSLFSGAGGLDYGFEKAGFTIIYANERNRDSAESWKLNRPGNISAMHLGDISDYSDEIANLNGVDIVFGGPPCQGFSVAGKMVKDDPRNELIHTFTSIVLAIRPRVFMMENVKALACNKRWEQIRNDVITRFKSAGYHLSFEVYNASHFGVSENRERLILVGSINGECGKFHEAMAKQEKKPQALREILKQVGVYGTKDNPVTCTAKVTLAKNPVIRKSAYSGMLVNGSGRPLNLETYCPTLTASMGGNRTPIIDQMSLDDESRTNWFEGLFDEILSEGSMLPYEVPEHIRRLTIREAAAIQTFPPDYEFVGPFSSQYRQIGNAVPCLFSEAIAKAIKSTFFND